MPGSMDSQFQVPVTASITGTGQNIDASSPNSGTSIIQLTGVWSATIVVEGSNDASNWVALQVVSTTTFLYATSMVASGIYIANTNGYQSLRVRASSYTSGTAVLTVYGSDATTLQHVQSVIRGATDGSLIGNAGDRLKTQLFNGSNAEAGTSSDPLRVDPTGTTTQPISAATLPLPSGAATSANQSTEITLLGAVAETAPASDTASSGLNGRLQRIAQRITSLISLIPSTIGVSWFSRLSDGTDTAQITANGDLQVVDGIKAGGVEGELVLATAGVRYEVKVGASALANRKFVTVACLTNNIWWGWRNTITTSTGTPLSNGQFITFSLDPNSTASIWLVGSTNNRIVRITESP